MATRLDGKAVAQRVRAQIAERVGELRASGGRQPGLTVVLVGEDPASQVYVRNKGRAAEQAGMGSETLRLDASSTDTEALLALIDQLNEREDVDGILVQLPLPAEIDSQRVLDRIAPAKDVDGFHPINVGHLVQGRRGFVPCTPAGIMALLEAYEVPIEGRNAVILGRSNIVGKPMALLLLHRNATVTVCHSRTRELASVARRADILVAALGRPGMVTEEYVKPGAVVIDVGINRVESESAVKELFAHAPERIEQFGRQGYALVGDVHPARVEPVAGALTPVPGGVGPLTIAFLLRNTLEAYEAHIGVSGGRG